MGGAIRQRLLGCPTAAGPIAAAILLLTAMAALAAPRAALVMDMRTGEVLYESNADARLHPASLTKMMTLYVTFQAVEHGEIGLDDRVTVSANVEAEPPSELGLIEGQRIKLRYLIRAAAVRSANDAATALAEAVGGSERAFLDRMNRTARAIGMTTTNFENAHGLDVPTHLSSARDMTRLGRQLFYDFPDYYNLFSRRSTHAGMRRVRHTNRRFLNAYSGADGIKTGYTSDAGFNMTGTARRGAERVIATVFGYPSVSSRNRRMAELLDLGFRKAPAQVALRRPAAIDYDAGGAGRYAQRTRTALAPSRSPVPAERPGRAQTPIGDARLVALASEVGAALAEPAEAGDAPAGALPVPRPRPNSGATALTARGGPDRDAAAGDGAVTWVSSSGGGTWAISLGAQPSRVAAESLLLETALAEPELLGTAVRHVEAGGRGYEAQFVGLNRAEAAAACAQIAVRGKGCTVAGPPGAG